MPTEKSGTLAPANPRETQTKLEGLISVLGDETDEAPSEQPPAAKAASDPPAPPPQSADTESPADEEPSTETIDVDGEAVPVSELKKGYLRQADYTRKTTALADERKTLEAKIRSDVESGFASERTQYVQGLATLRQALEELQGEPNWADLRGKLTDAEFLKQRADWEESKSQRERLRRHEEDERQKLQQAQAKQYQDFVRAEYDKLLTQIPDWSDTEKAKGEISKLKGFAKKQYGFDDVAINNGFSTAAIVLLIRDAMKYHELHREPSPAAKAKVSKIKSASPGTPSRPQPNERQTKLVQRAAQTGRSLDAMRAIEAMLPDD